jgi:hypothetical protein
MSERGSDVACLLLVDGVCLFLPLCLCWVSCLHGEDGSRLGASGAAAAAAGPNEHKQQGSGESEGGGVGKEGNKEKHRKTYKTIGTYIKHKEKLQACNILRAQLGRRIYSVL